MKKNLGQQTIEPELQQSADKADGSTLPPRRVKHPSHRGRLTRWFYLTLIFLFIALTVGLMWWGRQMLHPPDGSLLDQESYILLLSIS